MIQYKVLHLNIPPLTSFKYKKDSNGNYETDSNGDKVKEYVKKPMPEITGSETELVEFGLEAVLNRLGKDGWKLIGFNEDATYIFIKE